MNVNVATDGLAKTTPAPFEVERLGAKLGAEIHGLDLSKEWMPRPSRRSRRRWSSTRWSSCATAPHTRQHVEISRLFGELEVHPMRPQGEFPEILVLDNNKDNPVLSTDVWHSDTTFRRTRRITPSCAARSCPRSAAIRYGRTWKRPMTD